MSINRHARLGFLILALAGLSSVAVAQPQARIEWRFDAKGRWTGWTPDGNIRDIQFQEAGVNFRPVGSDPQITSPIFELTPATNLQWVEIDLTSEAPGEGELFYTNKTTGRYGGLEPDWMTRVVVPSAGRQTVRVWPFWEKLGKIIRLRLDPPSGGRCTLHAVRIMESTTLAPLPVWTFSKDASGDSWQSMHAARLEWTQEGLRIKALRPQALVVTPVEPFDAAKRSLLKITASCPGEEVIGFYWVTREHPGLMGEPIRVGHEPLAEGQALDLRMFPTWQGTVTHLGLAFGTFGNETLTLRKLSVEPNEPQQPVLRTRYLGFARPINRPNQPATIQAILEHAGGPAVPAGTAVLEVKGALITTRLETALPGIEVGGRAVLQWPVTPDATDYLRVQFHANGQIFKADLRVDPRVSRVVGGEPPAADYVPPPRPVKTRYNLGIYYFPGWSADQLSRWKNQRDFPEREPVLGWYAEGSPEVADWHIKWAVENGLSFFVYDWYWRNGKEELGAGLNEGFLKARYNHLMKFALMWANHKPFADHTPEQLLEVTDYWIERYFRRDNYLTLDGKPYVSFFSPGELISNLRSPEKTRAALDAMRQRVRAAGLPGLHIAACSGPDPAAGQQLKNAGFDSLTAYNYLRTGALAIHSPYRQFLLGHEAIWRDMREADALPYIPLLTVGWDARPWHGPRTQRKFARETRHFAEALRQLKAHLDATGERMAILEAWNEWGEGSYIEPNAEFGFKDLEAIREVFAERADFPVNIGPDDVGLGGRYDLRRLSPATTEPASSSTAGSVKRVRLAGVHPAVVKGMDLLCRDGRIELAPGEARIGDRVVTTAGGSVALKPAEIVSQSTAPITLVEGPVNQWYGGNRLTLGPDTGRNVLPGSFVPGTLRLVDPAAPEQVVATEEDVVMDPQWGAFALKPGGKLQPGQKVVAHFKMSLRRVDTLVLDAQGRLVLIDGEPSPDGPLIPEVPADALRLANLYRPFHAAGVEPEHVYVIRMPAPEPPPRGDTAALAPVLQKLRAGQDVTVVCWGDSVTACGDTSSPQTCYVGLLESGLKARFPEARIRVINAGIGGSSTPVRLPNFQKEVLAHKPDVVTLEYVNDMSLPVERMSKLYEEILRRTREAGAVLVIITPHFVMPAWMPFTEPGHSRDPRPGVAFLRKFARENGVPLADAAFRWEQLEALGIPYEILEKNGINHPDDRGHVLFAEELLRLFDN
ncbi:MAG TPA: glycoside hydrolase family 99-like domain-containing protein [Phycisphaerae bacterium]|nr:glycoside hydrolase family 99-like domain-containing protein [Phycisphaerae bacterium]